MKSRRTLAAEALAVALALPLAVQAAELGADRHAKVGVKCEACHDTDKANPKTPDFATCTGCHKVDALVEKTKGIKPTNPHVSPHYGTELDCTNCHMMHSESQDFCAQCHNFKYQVP